MNKKRIIIISIIVVSILSVLAFVIIKNQKNINQINNSKVSVIPTSKPPTPYPTYRKPEDSTMEISGVKVNNFYNSNPVINEREDTTFKISDQYQLIYFSKENEFLISILASPFEKVRQTAEQSFLTELQITKNQACKLKANITTPYYVNPNESGKNYRLSFCE